MLKSSIDQNKTNLKVILVSIADKWFGPIVKKHHGQSQQIQTRIQVRVFSVHHGDNFSLHSNLYTNKASYTTSRF